MVGKTLCHSPNYFSGTDEERLEELQAMLDMPEINAILLDAEVMVSAESSTGSILKIQKNPKWQGSDSAISP